MNERLKKITDEIMSHDKVLIISHVRPDGDTLACAFALKDILEQKGKKACCVCHENVSERLSFLCSGSLMTPDTLPEDFDWTLAVSVDVASRAMLGRCAPLLEKTQSVKIDHHSADDGFADVNYTEETAAACAEIIYDIAEYLGCLSDRVCELIYAGISFDTGCFKYSNVTEKTHRIASRLVSRGVKTGYINRLLFDERSKEEIEGLRLTYNSMLFYRDGKIALVCIDNETKREHGLTDDDIADIAHIPIEIKGVTLGITIKERSDEPGSYKVSMRSRPGTDAGLLCKKLGGGGHVCAAGGSVKASSGKEAIDIVLKAVGDAV